MTLLLSPYRLFLLQVSVSVTWNYILRLPCTTVAKFSVIHRHRSLNGYLLREISGIDDIECTKKCVKEPRCKSYNIHSGRKICQLSYKTTRDRGVVLSVAHGWVYKSTNYNKTKVLDLIQLNLDKSRSLIALSTTKRALNSFDWEHFHRTQSVQLSVTIILLRTILILVTN